ncbi:helix-turn-helix domain-containing protein [Streptomyces sp. NPDC006739]|uniref:helix-turn-helix domain-containing protein n=1 Tax=Streptomyces sp. NPDC006739 TaxID=3364763 RepID=UPI00368C8D65
MAEKKPNAVATPSQDVRRQTTHSGVTHVRAYHSGRYTIVGNHLAQHRELSLTAIGLATHILSLPEGAPVDIRSLAERFPEGRDRIAFALRELEAYGYLERVRERTEAGRLLTRTYAHHLPGAGTTQSACEDRRTPQDDDGGADRSAERAETPVRRPVRRSPSAEEVAQDGPHDGRHDRAVTLLAGLRRTDARLALSRRDVHALAPVVTTWFEGGAPAAVVHRALTVNLPDDMRHPASVLGYRLRELLPVPLPAVSAPPAVPADAPGGPRPHPFQTCDGCERAFRAAHAGRCRDCRSPSERPTPHGSLHAA